MDDVEVLMEAWRRERPDLDPAPMATFGRLGRLLALASAEIEAVLARHGLRIAEFDALAALRRSGPPYRLTPGRLAATLLVTSGGMTALLDRLEREGLVVRRPDPDDRRGVQVELTGKGFAVVDAAVTEHVANEERLLAPLSERERATLDRLAQKLLAPMAEARPPRPARRGGSRR